MKRAHRHPNLRLERWHRTLLYAVFGLLWGSALVWLLAHYWWRVPGEFGPVPHPWEAPAMKWHGACAMLALFWVGSLFNSHIRRALKHGHNRSSGYGMISTLLWLTLSGYVLYYFVGETTRPLWSWLHAAPGLLLPGLIVWHIWYGRRR
jgi:hypothetical protein